MYPYITIFGKDYGTYGLMALCGALIAGTFMCYLTRKRGLNDNESIILLLFTSVGVLIGGTLLYGITNLHKIGAVFSSTDFSSFIQNLLAIFGGSVFYGGLLGGIAAALITIRARKLSLPIFADMLAVCIPLFHAFARVGCFLGGCCYGIESKFGFTAHNNPFVPAINGVSRFPVQLLEAALNLVIFILLLVLYKKTLRGSHLHGQLIFVYLVLYAVMRFFNEFLRGDDIRGFVFGLSTSQFISCILFAVSTVWLTIHTIRRKRDIHA